VPERDRSPAPAGGPRLHGWLDPPVLGLAAIAAAAGFGQFGAVAALADVARDFGTVLEGDDLTLAEQAGLSGTVLGIGLAVIRLASILSLPLAGLADVWGRRRTLLGLATVGLLLVAATAATPSYWWFVVVFAVSRPLLTASNAIAGTTASEQTASSDRAKAIALLAAGFGVGAGLFAVLRGLASEAIGFRPVFALAIVGVVVVAVAGRAITEPDRYQRARTAGEHATPVLGAVHRRFLPRLLPVLGLAFAVAVVTGPANSFVFLYAESILDLSPAVSASLVAAAGVTGLAGLLAGRWGSDHLGRRVTGAAGLVGVALCGILTYSGTVPAAGAGYLLAVFSGSVFAPAAGALHAELFPTRIRGTVAGWTVAAGVLGAVTGLVAFGAIADRADRFDLAALAVFVPAAIAALLFALLPETRGQELEESAAG
jgi:MFS family permease